MGITGITSITDIMDITAMGAVLSITGRRKHKRQGKRSGGIRMEKDETKGGLTLSSQHPHEKRWLSVGTAIFF